MAFRSWKTKYNCLLKLTIGPCFLICGPLFHQQVLAPAAINDSICVLGGEKVEGSYDVNELYDLTTDE